MADDRSKNTIYVETDYDNIILIDPNKIVVNNEVKDRLVEHEDLVFYANLETKVIPRTKLAVGLDLDSAVVSTTIASIEGKEKGDKINFLQPINKKSFDTSWSDQLTGRGAKEGRGANQTTERAITDKEGTTRYLRDVSNYEDTQLLGISSIRVEITGGKAGGMFVPKVDIELIDIQGRTLFEQGEKSLYSVFFNLPYPLFYLTLKGYYGKAIRYSLNLTNFSASFDANSGNFNIKLSLIGKNSGLLSDSLLDYARTAPKMFPTVIQKTEPSSTNSTNTRVSDTQTSYGRQVLDEVYSIYKSKGLIAQDFPNLTIDEFIEDADSFQTNMESKIQQGDFVILSDISQFRNDLLDIKDKAYKVVLNNYLDTNNYIVYNGQIYYPFKNTLDFQKRRDIISAIKAEINNALDNMRRNASFGQDSTNGNQIPVNITDTEIFEEFDYDLLTEEDYKKTLAARLKRVPTDEQVQIFIAQLNLITNTKEIIKDITNTEIETFPTLLKYGEINVGGVEYVPNSFLNKIEILRKKIDEKEQEIETQLSDELAIKFFSKNGGLGYKPTLRNIMAILFAGLDSFYRIMDKTHTDAWDLRDNPKRVSTILPPDKNFGIDAKNSIGGTSENLKNVNVVYPWPTYFVEEKEEDGTEKYNIRYIGDPKYSDKTAAFDNSVWPEINFLEDYLTSSTKRAKEIKRSVYNNPKELAKYGSCNTVYFPFNDVPYENKSEISFFYEFYERAYLLSTYPKLVKSTFKSKQIDKFLYDLESKNIINAVRDSPSLVEKLKTKKYNLQTLRQELFNISNSGGIGANWADFERDKYVTDYLRNDIEKDYGLFDMSTIDARSISLDNTIPLIKNFEEYLRSSEISEFSFLDTLPFTDDDYVTGNTKSTKAKFFNETTKTYLFLDDKKTISRLSETEEYKSIKCFKDYANTQFKNFSTNVFFDKQTDTKIENREGLKKFFDDTDKKNYYLTVNDILLKDTYSGSVGTNFQKTTIFNTPYFINSILDGVNKEKNKVENPYTTLGYLYLAAMPLSDLTDFIIDTSQETDLDGFAATLKNFSAIHQIPYASILKFGSIWYRYKKYLDENVDILDDVWKNFDYNQYYDPFNNSLTTNFQIKNYTGGTIDFRGYKSQAFNTTQVSETFNTGFYPKMINDLHWYFTKKDLFTNYNITEFEDLYNQNKLKVGLNTEASYIMNLSGDPNNLNRSIIINPFFQYLTFDKDPLIDANYKSYLLIPSNGGSIFNQTVFECFNNEDKLNLEVKDNPAMYNGSVRTLWGAPQYGYFDNDLVTKPKYNEYLDFTTDKIKYIEDIFAVFKPEILDLFEKAFLGFCKPNPTAEDIFILENEIKSPSYTSTNKIKNIEERTLFNQIKKIFLVRDNYVQLFNQQNTDSVNLAQAQIKNITNNIQKFLSFDCILKIGNAGNFDRKLFNSFLNEPGFTPVEPFKFEEPYILNSLPGDGQTITLTQSKAAFNQEWKTLQKYVGFSTLPNVNYTNSGSVITDFFIDMNLKFSINNIKSLYPLIKIFARHKYEAKKNNQTFNSTTFKGLLRTFLVEINNFNNNAISEISQYLNKNLPTLKTKNGTTNSTVEGDVTKLSLYNVFQTLNDKWISGTDFKNKTLFEDFLFHDVSNNDIGDKIQIPMEDAKNILNADGGVDIYSVVGSILEKCGNMLFFSLPSYVNFYGIQQPSKNPQAINFDSAGNLFGTWTNVDYINSTAKFLCVYTGRESEKLPSKDNSFMIYGDDSYDFRNPATNPLRIEDNKQNKSLSNKVVGFNVDFGIRNQNIFKGFTVGMDDKKNTAATFQVRTNLANSASGGQIAQQSTSLYSFYKSLSYACTINSLGNVMIQPLMYFNLRHVPLFYGPYYIFNVSHNITINGFETTFKGSRMPKYALPQPDSLGTYIKTNYLEKYKSKILERKNTEGVPTEEVTILDPEGQKLEKEGLISDQQSCINLLFGSYTSNAGYRFVNIQKTPLTYEDFKTLLDTNVTDTTNNRVCKIILFTIALTRPTGASSSSGLFEPLNKNYFEINAVNEQQQSVLNTFELICTQTRGNIPTPLFSYSSDTGSIFTANSIVKPTLPVIDALNTINGGTNITSEVEAKSVAQYAIRVWDAGFFNESANEINDAINENLNRGTITEDDFQSYINIAKIAQTYFPS
jgi:hypothetical protein